VLHKQPKVQQQCVLERVREQRGVEQKVKCRRNAARGLKQRGAAKEREKERVKESYCELKS